MEVMNSGDSEKGAYPARSRREVEVSSLKESRPAWIAGRIVSVKGRGLYLKDASGRVPLRFSGGDGGPDWPGPGDIMELYGSLDGGTFTVRAARLLAPGREAPSPDSPNNRLFSGGALPFLRRNRVKEEIRSFFGERNFIEVETPVLVPAPGQEPFLEPFSTTVATPRGERPAFLITSPEYCHKRLLAAGFEKIFEMARVFRNGPEEGLGHHWFEFTMLEWYRAYGTYREIMEDVETLVVRLSDAVGAPLSRVLRAPFRRLSVAAAFRELAGVDLAPYLSGSPDDFARREAAAGRFGLAPEDPPDTRFFKVLVGGVEPALAGMGPLFLVDYPASQAALAKIKTDAPSFCERFELYVHGVEVANGFTELNDPEEQRRRFVKEQRIRKERGESPLPLDEAFLEALELGMPPAGGVAVGLERLMMILFGEKTIDPFLPFGGCFTDPPPR